MDIDEFERKIKSQTRNKSSSDEDEVINNGKSMLCSEFVS